jgi:hypothetical protein
MKQSSSNGWPASGPDCKPAETLPSVRRYRGIVGGASPVVAHGSMNRDRLEKKTP